VGKARAKTLILQKVFHRLVSKDLTERVSSLYFSVFVREAFTLSGTASKWFGVV